MNTLPQTQSIQLEQNGAWLTVWFNQPERRNPLTDDVVEELTAVCLALREDASVRGITFRGRGGFFCAGGDLKGFQSLAEGPEERVLETSQRIGELLALVDSLPQVTVALIEGAAMAGGLGLACCCDVAIATDDARFAFSETRIGISPAQIAHYVLQKCGYAVGRRLMLTAARFRGDEASRYGLVDVLVGDQDGLVDAEKAIQRDVLSCAPGAIAATKSLIRGLQGIDAADRIAYAGQNFANCLKGDEGREGVASFLEKRTANWHVEI